MSPTLIPLALVGVALLGSALAKLAAPGRSASALAWVVPAPGLRSSALAALVVVEAALVAAIGLVLVGAIPALAVAPVVAGFLVSGAALLARAATSGRSGEPCGCFGAHGRIGWSAVAQSAGTAALALLALVPADPVAWLAVGVALALLACGALGVAALALAREIGELRLALSGDVALEISDEGPAVGERAPGWPAEAFPAGSPPVLRVAVFTSEGCLVCAKVAPAVEHLERDPAIAVARFDEVADGPVWAALGVPGSPYAIVADADGTALAKGTFNSLPQLESVVATAARRRSEWQRSEGTRA